MLNQKNTKLEVESLKDNSMLSSASFSKSKTERLPNNANEKNDKKDFRLLCADVMTHIEIYPKESIEKIRTALAEHVECLNQVARLAMAEKNDEEVLELEKKIAKVEEIIKNNKLVNLGETISKGFQKDLNDELSKLKERYEKLNAQEIEYLEAQEKRVKSRENLRNTIETAKKEQVIREFKDALKKGNVSKEIEETILKNLAQSNFSLDELKCIFLETSKGQERNISLEDNNKATETIDRVSMKFIPLKIALISCALYKSKLSPKILIPNNSDKKDAIEIVKKMGFDAGKINLVSLNDDEKKYYEMPYFYNEKDASCLVAQDIGQATYLLKEKFNEKTMKTKKSLMESGANKMYWRFDVIETLCSGKNDEFVFSVAPALILSLLEGRIKKSLEN